MQLSFQAIGTQWLIDIPSLPEGMSSDSLLKKILDRIEEFDRNYSRFRTDSLVTQMSKHAGTYQLPEDGKTLMDSYEQFYQATNGAVTPLIGNVMEQAGYDASYSLEPGQLSAPLFWGEALEYNYPTLEIKQAVLLDFGAAGKGYLVDIISQLLESERVTQYCVDASGDIFCRDLEIKVGLENPTDPTQAIGIVNLNNQSLCASSGNRRKWAEYNHIIDPTTLKSPDNILGTWAIADTGIRADGLATCLYFSPAERLKSQFEFEYLILYKGHRVEKSPGFPAELFFAQ